MSQKRVILLTSHFPPMKGGVSDHASKLSKILPLVFLVAPTHRENAIFLDRWNNPFKIISAIKKAIKKEGPESILLIEYVPYMYHRLGLCFSLLFALLWLKLHLKVKISLFVHEFAYPFEWSVKSAILSTFQSLIGFGLLNISNLIFCSCQRLKDQITPFSLLEPVVIPVGSNIDLSFNGSSPIEDRYLTTFGGIHPTKRFDLIFKSLLKTTILDDYRFVFIGQSEDNLKTFLKGEELEKAIALVRQGQIIMTGYIEEEEVARYLKYSSAHLTYFSDGASLRRGSLLAALSFKLSCVSTMSRSVDKELRTIKQLSLLSLEEKSYVESLIDYLENRDFEKISDIGSVDFLSWSFITKKIKTELEKIND